MKIGNSIQCWNKLSRCHKWSRIIKNKRSRKKEREIVGKVPGESAHGDGKRERNNYWMFSVHAPGTALSISHLISHFLSHNLRGRNYYFHPDPDLSDVKNWHSRGLTNLPKIIKLLRGVTRNWTQAVCLQSSRFKVYDSTNSLQIQNQVPSQKLYCDLVSGMWVSWHSLDWERKRGQKGFHTLRLISDSGDVKSYFKICATDLNVKL